MKLSSVTLPAICLLALSPAISWGAPETSGQINRLVTSAVQNDFALKQSEQTEKALLSSRDAVQSLPDPRVSVNLLNVPTDGFALDEQAMTQLKLGVSQRLPRGDSVALSRQAINATARQQPVLRALRQAEIRKQISRLWIDNITLFNSIKLVSEQLTLLSQLSLAVENNYASSSGASQFDVLSTDVLETELEDRLETLESARQTTLASLTTWIPEDELISLTDGEPFGEPNQQDQYWLQQLLSPQLPADGSESLYRVLQAHPSVLVRNAGIEKQHINQQQVDAGFAPQWEFNASYAYRQDDPMNQSRADFFSVGVSVDVPLFSSSVKAAALKASVMETASLETQKRLVIQQLYSEVKQLLARVNPLRSRIERYTDTLLPLRQQHYEAALNAYTAANGNFTDVMQSHLALIDTRVKLLSLEGEFARLTTDLQFFIPPNASTEKMSYEK